MSDTLPLNKKIADLRQWRAASREPRLPDDERKARTMEFLRRLEFAAPMLLDAAEECDTLRAERDELASELERVANMLIAEEELSKNLEAERDALLNKRCEKCGAFAVNCVTAEHCASCELDRYEAEIAKLRAEHDAALAENSRLRALPEWIIRKLKTMEYYESPTDDRDIRSEIQGWFHVLCFHYVHSRREVKMRSENCKAMKQLEAESARLRDLLARVQVEDRWRPISEATKNHQIRVIGAVERFVVGDIFFGPASLNIGRFRNEGESHFLACQELAWRYTQTDEKVEDHNQPTHYRPLPLTPAEEAELDALRKAVAMEGETP